jgi:hypothetical protein
MPLDVFIARYDFVYLNRAATAATPLPALSQHPTRWRQLTTETKISPTRSGQCYEKVDEARLKSRADYSPGSRCA